jgi:tetratricopeptide (TPR) repeat protein
MIRTAISPRFAIRTFLNIFMRGRSVGRVRACREGLRRVDDLSPCGNLLAPRNPASSRVETASKPRRFRRSRRVVAFAVQAERMWSSWRPALIALAFALSGCPRPPPPPPPPPPVVVKKEEPPLKEVTLQMGLEAAWDGEFALCFKYAKTAITIAADDLESMELMMRCARASGGLADAEKWVREAYAARMGAPVVRYGLAIVATLRGDASGARKLLEKLAEEAPVAAYQGALAAVLEDDWAAADKLAAAYVKARPDDPDGRALQARIACVLDVARCGALQASLADDDADEALRLGAALGSEPVTTRAKLTALSKEAEQVHAPAYSDELAVLASVREGGDPGLVGVRSPRSGRREPGPGVDLVTEARPMSKLPFATRVTQAVSIGDANAATYFGRLLALFPTDFATYQLAAESDRTLPYARAFLEEQASGRWRVYAASFLVTTEQVCDLTNSMSWKDQGPIASSIRRRCDIALDKPRGRALADARLSVSPFGVLDVRAAIEGEATMRDATALEALARRLQKVAPSSQLVVEALWAAADAGHKKGAALQQEALTLSTYDPTLARKQLRRYVDRSDWKGARALLGPALAEAPSDAFLCGVQGELLMQEGKHDAALPFLTRACTSARARRDSDVLATTFNDLWTALPKAKDKSAKDAASKCLKGD